MAITFPLGKIAGPEDLVITLVDAQNRPVDAYEIHYALYDVTTGVEVLIGPPERRPVHPEIGKYYAAFQIPENANLGLYRVRWTFREVQNGPENIVMEEFKVTRPEEAQLQIYSPIQLAMINRMRILSRDNKPDRNYHFRPPTSESTLNQYNRVFAYIWEDEELIEYMERAVDFINLSPPETKWHSIDEMVRAKPAWRQMILMGGLAHAAMALAFNWVADEFDYSIGGVSLSIDRSSKYESLKNNAESQFDKMLESKARTVKVMRGLQQSRYGIGVRSALGPVTGHGVMTPAKYAGFNM